MQRGQKALLHEELKENAYWDIKVFVMKQWTSPIMILSGTCEVLGNYHIDTNKRNRRAWTNEQNHNKLSQPGWEEVAKGNIPSELPSGVCSR